MSEHSDASNYRERAYQILACREHSAYELRQKLERKGCPPELAEDLVGELTEARLVVDVRFGTVLVRSKLRQGWGRQRILRELSLRGVRGEALEAVLSGNAEVLNPDREQERADAIARRRLRTPADAARVMRCLIGHGFTLACARRAVEPYIKEDFVQKDGGCAGDET